MTNGIRTFAVVVLLLLQGTAFGQDTQMTCFNCGITLPTPSRLTAIDPAKVVLSPVGTWFLCYAVPMFPNCATAGDQPRTYMILVNEDYAKSGWVILYLSGRLSDGRFFVIAKSVKREGDGWVPITLNVENQMITEYTLKAWDGDSQYAGFYFVAPNSEAVR